MQDTFENLIQRTISRLSMASGVSVQTYAEDRIGEMIQHKFDMLFDELWWKEFLNWIAVDLDGITGVSTTNFTDIIKRFSDIRTIYHNNTDTEILILPSTTNPYSLSGTTPLYIEPTNNKDKVFRIWPLTSISNLKIQYRTKPNTFIPADTVPFDDQALILGACYDYCEDDGHNPGQTDKFLTIFESRVKQLKLLRSNLPISTDAMFPRNRIDAWIST